MKKIKRCFYCKEIINENTSNKLCKNCLTLREVKKSINFKCEPPETCFICPYPDCVSPKQACTQQELEYLKCAGFKRYRR